MLVPSNMLLVSTTQRVLTKTPNSLLCLLSTNDRLSNYIAFFGHVINYTQTMKKTLSPCVESVFLLLQTTETAY